MMDKEKYKREAEKFNKADSCYIHIEKDGDTIEQMVAGDSEALIWCITNMIERIAELSHGLATFNDVMKTILAMHQFQKIIDKHVEHIEHEEKIDTKPESKNERRKGRWQ